MEHDKWNPWHGCKKCSDGCKNCYMYYQDRKRGVKIPPSVVRKTGKFDYPVVRYRNGDYKVKSGERLMVNMTSDTFIEEADEWRGEMWKMIKERSDVVFWLLTKRPQRFSQCLPDDWGDGYENVSLNITCEDHNNFATRIRYLLNTPAKHKGLCLAPLLGPIDISFALKTGQIEEVTVGGENYENPRICKHEWVKDIALQCQKYKVNFCFYETGTLFDFNGDTFVIKSKAKQSRLAFVCGFNQKYYDVDYKLYDENGEPFDRKAKAKRVFNKNHCFLCSNKQVCSGCGGCAKKDWRTDGLKGECGPVVLVSEEEILKAEANYMEYLKSKNGIPSDFDF